MGGGGHRCPAVGQGGGGLADEFGIDQRLVALHVDDDGLRRQAEDLCGFGQAGGAAFVAVGGEHGFDAVRLAGRLNFGGVGGDDDARRAAFACLFGHAHDHGFASDVGQRFARQAAGREAGGDDDGEIHIHAANSSSLSSRASLSSI